MKILLAATSVEDFSGASKCLVELAVFLKQIGHDITVSLPKNGGHIETVLEEKNISYLVVREYQCWYREKRDKSLVFKPQVWIKRFLNEISVKKCRRILKRNKYDIVHINAMTAYVVGKAAIKEKIPTLWHIREFMEEDLGISFIFRNWSLKLLNHATRFVAISKPIFDKWSKLLKPPIDIVYDGIDISNYYVKKKIMHDKIRILIYGRIVPGKGQLFFIKGAKRILTKINHPCEFAFAGIIEDEAYYKVCTDYIKNNSLEKNITYLGQVKDIKELLSKTDIVCVCSTMEGFGRVTIESILGGCIVLGANTGATKEIISDHINGYIYKQGNLDDFCTKLTDIINNIETNRILADMAKEDAKIKYSIENSTKRIVNIYENIM